MKVPPSKAQGIVHLHLLHVFNYLSVWVILYCYFVLVQFRNWKTHVIDTILLNLLAALWVIWLKSGNSRNQYGSVNSHCNLIETTISLYMSTWWNCSTLLLSWELIWLKSLLTWWWWCRGYAQRGKDRLLPFAALRCFPCFSASYSSFSFPSLQ